jgi:hypothetical protein
MSKLWLLAVSLVGILVGQVYAQGLRSQGMAGLLLPGPASSYLNPAYAAFPNRFSDASVALPIGLLGLLRPENNPLRYLTDRTGFKNSFDGLSFYDQFSHPYSFLINPVASPDEIVFELSDPNNVRITDGKGNKLNTNFSLGNASGRRLTPAPLFSLPLDLGFGLILNVGIFEGTQLSVLPDANLSRLLGTGRLEANTAYGVNLTAAGQAGISLGITQAAALPGGIYVGARAEGFYGLGYAEASGKASVSTDDNRSPSQNAQYSGKAFYSTPFGGVGTGFGVRADAGLALEADGVIMGLGIRNLVGYTRWTGNELEVLPDGQQTTRPSERTSSGFAPAFYFNIATATQLNPGSLVVGADLVWEGSLVSRVGLEYGLGPLRLRSGLGYEGGLRFGLGAGWSQGGFSIDTALTTHQGPLVGGTVYGIGLGLGFGF